MAGQQQKLPAKARGGYTRRRQGCLTCRKRKKKCDQTYPICGHCSRLNLVCQREAPRTVVSGNSTDDQALQGLHAAPAVPALPTAKQYATLDLCHVLGGGADGSSSRAMLRYYTSCFSFLLTTNLENNCFLSVLLPMAFECAALMQALVAWASTHLALRDKRFEADALRHRGTALAALAGAMDGDVDGAGLSHEMGLAVTMVFCSMESIADGRSAAWYLHLVGGAAVLGVPIGGSSALSREAQPFRMPLFEGTWLLRNFAYHDILMSVSMDQRPLLAGDYWMPDARDGEEDGPAKADPYFGLAAPILRLVGQISHLRADFADSAAELFEAQGHPSRLHAETQAHALVLHHDAEDHPFTASFAARAQAIEHALLAWQCPVTHAGSSLEQLAEAYRSAALIHLYRTLRRYLTGYDHILHQKVQRHVRAICAVARAMSSGCLAECTLLFPLFMAGGEATGEDPAVLRSRLLDMNRWRHFRNVDACIDVLDELWRLRAEQVQTDTCTPPDWLDVVQARGYTLALT